MTHIQTLCGWKEFKFTPGSEYLCTFVNLCVQNHMWIRAFTSTFVDPSLWILPCCAADAAVESDENITVQILFTRDPKDLQM